MVLTDREPLALQCALLGAQASGVADEADTLAALRLLEGQAVQHAPRVGALLQWDGPCEVEDPHCSLQADRRG